MGIWSFLTQSRHARFVARLASEIAQRSYSPVSDRVRRRATTMRIAEARGYVRSRALEIIHRELASLRQEHKIADAAVREEIAAQASELLVVRILAELRSVPKDAARPTRRQAA